jgi:hypothetical protein
MVLGKRINIKFSCVVQSGKLEWFDFMEEGDVSAVYCEDSNSKEPHLFFLVAVTVTPYVLQQTVTDDYGITFKKGSHVFDGKYLEWKIRARNIYWLEETKTCMQYTDHLLVDRVSTLERSRMLDFEKPNGPKCYGFCQASVDQCVLCARAYYPGCHIDRSGWGTESVLDASGSVAKLDEHGEVIYTRYHGGFIKRE